MCPLGRPSGKPAILARVHALLDTGVPRSNNVPVSRVLAILEAAVNGEVDERREKKLLAAYALFAGAVFLAPQTATARVPDELLAVVQHPERISHFDICRLVVDVLRKGAVAARDMLPLQPSKMILPGCLLVPLILFMDAKEHGVDALGALPFPRIADYSKSTMQEMMKKHFPPKLFDNQSINFVDGDATTATPGVVNPGTPADFEAQATSAAGPSDDPGDAGACGGDNLGGDESIKAKITRAAVAALSLSLERTKLGDAKDLECWEESMRIIELERKKKTMQIMKLGCERKQKEMKDMLDKFVAEVMQLLSYEPGTGGSEWSERATNRFMSLPEGDQGREALAALARGAASAIQSAAMNRVCDGSGDVAGSAVHTVVHGVGSSTPMDVDVASHIPDLNAVSNPAPELVDPSSAAQSGIPGHTGASMQAPTPLASMAPPPAGDGGIGAYDGDDSSTEESSSDTDDDSSDSSGHSIDFLGDGAHYEISSDDEPPRQIRRHSINTPRRNLSIQQPVFDNSAPHENGAAPVVAAPAVPVHLAPFVIDNGRFGLSPFQLGVSHPPPPIHWISFSESAVQCQTDEIYMDWFIHGMPWELIVAGDKMVDSFRENGDMTYYTVDAGVRMFNEKEKDMMEGTGYDMWRCMVLANFAVQFLSTPGDYDIDAAVNMFYNLHSWECGFGVRYAKSRLNVHRAKLNLLRSC